MKERPILFSGAMVRTILAGSKTQTRRVCASRYAPISFLGGSGQENDPACWGWAFDGPDFYGYAVLERGLNEQQPHGRVSISCPYGEPGDRLWVRETWAPHADEEETFRNYQQKNMGCSRPEIFYAADGGDPHINNWRPSIHMPRWASRIALEVTEVRVQRLQDISEEDARSEGVERSTDDRWPWRNYNPLDGAPFVHATTSFMSLWDSINGKRPGCSWKANPWVWAISFTRLTQDRKEQE